MTERRTAMNRTTIGLVLFCAGITFGSAEPATWNIPVGIAAAIAGVVLMNWKSKKKPIV